MITIHNKQRVVSLDTRHIRAEMNTIITAVGYKDFDVSVVLLSPAGMKKYNKNFRKKDEVTDILSFPYHPTVRAGEQIKVESEEDKNLGDILLCPLYIYEHLDFSCDDNQECEHACAAGKFYGRVRELLVHGACHLLGYDHETDADYRVMLKKEKTLLKSLL